MERGVREPEFKSTPVESIRAFRHLGPSDPLFLPEAASNRKCTDIVFLILFQLCQIILIVSSVFVVITGDARITLLGRDACDNVCGMENIVKFNETCPLKDYTQYPIALLSEKRCITLQECEKLNMIVKNYICLKKLGPNLTKAETALTEAEMSYGKVVQLSITTVVVTPVIVSVLAIVVFRLFKRNAFFTFYFFATFTSILFAIATPVAWYAITMEGKKIGFVQRQIWFYYILVSILTLITISLPILLFWRRKKVGILIEIYREMIPAIFKSCYIMFVPVLATLALIVIGVVFFFLYVYAISVKLPQNAGLPITRYAYIVFMCFMAYWIFMFAVGCQSMITAGAVASYFFSRDKAGFKNQYFNYAKIVTRFHLGTIALGSLIVVVISVIKYLLQTLRNHEIECIELFLEVICHCLDEFMHYISVKAYIMTAIHGRNFLKSGKRAIRMMWVHFLDLIQVDGFNLVAMFSAGVIIIFVCMLFATAITWNEHPDMQLSIGILTVIMASVIIYIFLSMITMSIGTVFLCYCEDQDMNDGSQERPYFMDPKLEATINEALEFSALKKAEKVQQLQERRRQAQQDT